MRRRPPAHAAWAVPVLAAALSLASPTLAQDDPAAPPPERTLEAIEAEIEAGRARIEALNREADILATDAASLRRQLVDAAAKVQATEQALSEVEQRLARLLNRQSALVEDLDQRRASIATLVNALQSLALHQPPALGVTPEDAAQAARSAMLLNSIIPTLTEEARTLERELQTLARLREDIRKEQLARVAAARSLESEQAALEAKIGDMTERRRAVMASAEAEQQRLSALAGQAQDVRGFLKLLAERGHDSLPRPRPNGAESRTAALGGPAAIPFRSLKGRLRPPVAGELRHTFGDILADGGQSRGLVFTTRAGAQVVAPADGIVAFSGPFKGYGLLLIIRADDGYHFVLAGMGRIDAVARQRLLAGEPVGIMASSRPEPGAEAMGELYVELRRDGEPVDPLPWLSLSGGRIDG